MLEAKLTPCASMLYRWIRRRDFSSRLRIDLQDFQAWSGEYRERPYTISEIFDALGQLQKLHLLTIAKTEVTLDINSSESIPETLPRLAPLLLPQEKRPNPYKIISLVIIGSFFLGLIPILIGFAFANNPNPALLSFSSPWSVLADKNSP